MLSRARHTSKIFWLVIGCRIFLNKVIYPIAARDGQKLKTVFLTYLRNLKLSKYAHKGPSIKDVRKNLPFFDPPPPCPGVSKFPDPPLPTGVRTFFNF